jgi:hypothetical protein
MNRSSCILLGLLLSTCNVQPLHIDQQGLGSLLDEPAGTCGRGLVVVQSDYESSNVVLLGNSGDLLSPSLVGSGTFSAGLSVDFSGDLVLPTTATPGEELILLDRYPASVVSFVSLRDAQVRAQLDVSTGFRANPRDAIALPSGLIYVTRYDTNTDSGHVPFDEGADLLIIDPTVPAIVDRISLAEALPQLPEPLLPHPDRGLVVGTTAYVVVATYSLDYHDSGSCFVVAIDTKTHAVQSFLELPGRHGCTGMALRADSAELVVACSGKWRTPAGATVAESALVGIDVTDGMRISWELPASRLSPRQPFGFSVAYASADQVVAVAYGSLDTGEGDRVVTYRPKDDAVSTLHESPKPFSLGDVTCMTPCPRCAVADATEGGILFWDFDGKAAHRTFVALDDAIGLPPRWLGRF